MAEEWTIATASRALHSGALSAVALTEACLQRVAERDPALRAFVTVTADRALADAEHADQVLQAGANRGPLLGIPIALKDLIETDGILTTAGSRVLAEYVPTMDAAVALRLAAAGTVLVGKTNTHEFAWGVFTPPTRNPWDRERIPGGSSGGSAAAVAAGEVLGALGTDTGGSIRIPAACCGVTGFKPTYGLVSTDGIIPLSHTLDHAGPIARTVEDCALLLDAIVDTPRRPFALQLNDGINGVRLGVLGDMWEEGVDPAVLAAFRAAASVLVANTTSVESPFAVSAGWFHAYRMIQSPEATAYHQDMGWFPQLADRYTLPTRSYLERGTMIAATEFARALRLRESWRQMWDAWLDRLGLDILLAPTIPMTAPRVVDTEDPAKSQQLREALLRLTFPFNMLGMPALSVPCGLVNGLPVGMQIIGRRGADALVLRVGHALQQRSGTLPVPPL
jgi:aspartyl-tRNA(Asn)/glutamyl-tRNA(Gln) amidotransferase subunit A